MRLSSLSTILCGLWAATVAAAGSVSVPLDSIETLTFYKGALTEHRRLDPIPQLNCRGPACSKYEHLVEVIQCSRMGHDGTGSPQWKCDADLPAPLRLGKVDVSCEGYYGAEDPNVLRGSCGLSYALIHPNMSEEKPESGSSFATIAFTILWLSALAFIVYSFLKSCMGNRQAQADDNSRDSPSTGDDAPPPYTSSSAPSGHKGAAIAGGAAAAGLAGAAAARGLGGGPSGRNAPRPVDSFPRYGGIPMNDDEYTRARWGGSRMDGGMQAGPSRSGPCSGDGPTRSTSGFGGSTTR